MNNTSHHMASRLARLAAAAGLLAMASIPLTSQACSNRGQLDTAYCDANKDLVADAPAAGARRSPGAVIFAIAAYEDPAVAKRTFEPFVESMGQCMKKQTTLYYGTSEPQVIEAMRTGRVHVAMYGAGATMFAVNQAGAVPFAGRGKSAEGKLAGYNLIVITKADSSIKTLADLKGKKVAHSSATSNSGNLAPRALFPKAGVTPDKDYKVEFSGKHDKSIIGVGLGLYDAAATASDVFDRMVDRKEIDPKQYRIVYRSEPFPTDAFAHANDLDDKTISSLKQCMLDYKFPAEMQKSLENNDRFFAMNYSRDFATVRAVAQGANQSFDRVAYKKLLDSAKK